jgi:crossover junction endodeoxyribonuclease RusA
MTRISEQDAYALLSPEMRAKAERMNRRPLAAIAKRGNVERGGTNDPLLATRSSVTGSVKSGPAIESITITMPCPPKPLWQNRAGHWTKRSDAARTYRIAAHALALMELRGRTPPRWDKAMATLNFFWPDNIRRDVRNAEAAMKPAYDGIVDAGIITDDSADVLTHGPTRFELDREQPRVVVRIEPLQER